MALYMLKNKKIKASRVKQEDSKIGIRKREGTDGFRGIG